MIFSRGGSGWWTPGGDESKIFWQRRCDASADRQGWQKSVQISCKAKLAELLTNQLSFRAQLNYF